MGGGEREERVEPRTAAIIQSLSLGGGQEKGADERERGAGKAGERSNLREAAAHPRKVGGATQMLAKGSIFGNGGKQLLFTYAGHEFIETNWEWNFRLR